MSSITPEFLKQKAREISYALNRVSFYIRRDDLRNRLERLSFEFLENVASGSEDVSDKKTLFEIFKNIAAMDVLIRLAHSLYEIEPVNANILVKELDSFNSAIRQFGNAPTETIRVRQSGNHTGELPNLETMFSMPPAVIENSETATIDKEKEIVEKAYSTVNKESGNSPIKPFSEQVEKVRQSFTQSIDPSIAIRQKLIAERVRQLSKANLKDLAIQFPNVSERTLRYDLQRLCDRGIIEKIGNSGPGTSYIPKSDQVANN